MTSFYLAEYDVDYTANHHQSIKDIPGVPDIALNMAAIRSSRRRGEGRGEARRRRCWIRRDCSERSDGGGVMVKVKAGLTGKGECFYIKSQT